MMEMEGCERLAHILSLSLAMEQHECVLLIT